MRPAENIEKLINNVPINTNAKRDKEVLDDVLDALERSKKAQSAAVQPNIWSTIMKSKTAKLAAAAVVIIGIVLGLNFIGAPIDGASEAFAAAMDSVKQARTFSCIEIFEATYEDDGKRGKFLMKQTWMFKEPYRERYERLTSPWPQYIGEVTIMDYGTRQQLELRPVEKTATLYDLSSDYDVDDNTGMVELTQLDTSLRDRLLKLTVGAVEDFGSVELDGQPVRMLQSHRDNRITTVWVDPETDFPVQIEIKWTDQSQSPVLYTSIQIDTELDDDLFSLEPPEGYTVSVLEPNWSDEQKKMLAKVRHLCVACMVYANKHNDQYPVELADLVTADIITDEALRNVLAAPDEPDGPPVIRYCQPNTDAEDWSTEVLLYEVYDERSADGRVVVIMLDSGGHAIPVQALEQHLKQWPANKKMLSVNMAYLHWLCDRYAQENEGQYPEELADLAGGNFSDERIKRLQTAPDQPDGPTVIRYRPPRAGANPSSEVILYEIYDQWPDDGAVVCYADGHCEVILNQNYFEELIR
jgi:outer membrane lipoprotein-sorting protein